MKGKQRPKRRGAKPAKTKVRAKRPAKVHDVRKRLAESLAQQAATAEILKVISGTPTDVQPVFDNIVRNAGRVCDAADATLGLLKNDEVTIGAHWGPIGAGVGTHRPLTRGSVMGRTIVDARPIHVEDLQTASEFPEGRELAMRWGHRTTLGVPLLREGDALGALVIRRTEVRPFSDTQIAMLQTFADQAVIAIENVRLFNETREALEQQTATSEILGVISSSPTDIQPVFDTLAESAARLCESFDAFIFLRDGDRMRLVANHGSVSFGPIGEFTLPLIPGTVAGRTVLEGRAIHLADIQAEVEEFPEGSETARRVGHRAILSVPLMREGVAIGAIGVRRTEARLFTDRQVVLLQTFADQAVIAIENVRLFTELEARNREVTEALDQKTATSEILGVISRSPTDVQPVFDMIAESAARLCEAQYCFVYRFEGQLLHFVAHHGLTGEVLEINRSAYPAPPSRMSVAARAILERSVVQIPDVDADPDYALGAMAAAGSYRSAAAVPILRDGLPIGSIAVTRAQAGLLPERQIELLKTFADQAVIAIENVRLFTELEARNREVTEALDQKTATSEILRVIASSPTDLQPVFDTIAERAMRLCDAAFCAVHMFDGALIHINAIANWNAEGADALRRAFPRPATRTSMSGRVILTGDVVEIPDVLADPEYQLTDLARAAGYRSSLGVPMLHREHAIGVITVTRSEPGAFSQEQIHLLKTFADQAVIAVENVRLFNETKEALEQQTATSEILRAISSSPTDVQPVFDIIAESAVRLCGGEASTVTRFDGEWVHLAAVYGSSPEGVEAVRRSYPVRAGSASGAARSIRDRAISHIPDVLVDPGYSFQEAAVVSRFRASLAVPMLHEGRAIGAIAIGRSEPGEFSERQVGLLRTFADQAIIAIENVRLFKELQASNHELTSALDTQTATSDILRVISRSQTNVQPVFDAIVASAVRLLRGYTGSLSRVAGDQLELAALTSTDAAGDASLRALFPVPLHAEGPHAQAIRDRAPINIADADKDPRVLEAVRASVRARGYRSWVTVPLLRPDGAAGAISVTRREPGGFTDDEIALLKTFADQAVIAIENARLLSELQQKNEALTQAHAQVSEALEQQTATAEILRVMSQSQTDVQPVFDTIVRSAMRLCDGLFSVLFQFDGELLHLVAQHDVTPEGIEELHRIFPARPTRALGSGRAILERALVHIPDTELDPEFQHLPLSRAVGFRSGLFVPMMREGAPIGVITVNRAEPGPFSDSEIELLKTFADQAVIAVENVRLFKELEARTADLTRSVEQLTALGEVGRAVSSTLDLETVLTTIVSRAVELSRLDGGVVFEYEEASEEFVHRAATETGGALAEARRATRVQKGEGVVGRTAITLEPVQVPDITMPGAHESRLRENLIESGVRAILAVPMVREGRLIGSLVVSRNQPGDFPTETIELLRTFATQSALAIQNARLFHEIADKSRQLEAASRHKSEFLANMSHELRTPLNAIIGFSEVLNERMFGELNDKQAEYLKDIHASGTHLLSLINDILDLSKVEAGRMELELSDFDLPAAIDSALMLVRERATRRGIALGAAIGDGIGGMTGDERKIRQVLLNLLSNAIKFTPEGGRIDVAAAPNNGLVEVSVRDTGVGIAPEDQEAVFEEFRQVGASAAKREGTGLGLALSRKFIELHGGKIWVTSQLGAGSTFTFTLPVQQPSGA